MMHDTDDEPTVVNLPSPDHALSPAERAEIRVSILDQTRGLSDGELMAVAEGIRALVSTARALSACRGVPARRGLTFRFPAE